MALPADHSLARLQTSLSLARADAIIDGAIALGAEHGLLPLTVAVVDAGGQLVALKRQDGSGTLRVAIAIGKASAAVGMGMSTRLIRDRLVDRPHFINALAATAEGRFVPVPGGVLILGEGGTAIGAVGISGDASDRDEFCAIAAVSAIGLASEPAQPAADWKGALL